MAQSKVGREVLVVGGASGIGRATAEMLVRQGYSVIIADFTADEGTKVATELGGDFVPINVIDADSVRVALDTVFQAHPDVDLAVNCAGIGPPLFEAHEMPVADFRRVVDVDLTGTFIFARDLIARWRKLPGRLIYPGGSDEGILQRGSLVNIASISGTIAMTHMSPLVAAKHGVLGVSKSFALENVSLGIRVNCVSPGCVFTPIMLHPRFDVAHVERNFLAQQAVKRFAHPDEIASGICFLLSDDASFVTGADMKLDAGYGAH